MMSDGIEEMQASEQQTISQEGSGADVVSVEDAVPVEGSENLGSDATGETTGGASAEELQQEIASLRAQLDDRTTQFMRIAADFDNFRKRTQKEREDLELQVKCSTVIEILPVVDNFERARSQIKPQTEEGLSVHKSYQGVYKDLVDRLKRIGVAQMRSEGQEFDPNFHEAVLREASAEYPEGAVIEELVRGYTLGERVLRHAMVKVAAAPEDGGSTAPESSTSEASEA
ncbi:MULTISPECIES: nucleotide exchange factor GrpE [unclassified Leptolyngbya]|uniref:nucleotide exchange factor GrpE n=1 Tax=unclassified Leptolyngbya TaxID=2650499 RepID=UPI001F5539E0|nr:MULTISPECIES: nucleotide exchange factor GrpE [unclassified Leptolyngbya]